MSVITWWRGFCRDWRATGESIAQEQSDRDQQLQDIRENVADLARRAPLAGIPRMHAEFLLAEIDRLTIERDAYRAAVLRGAWS
jgi:hypothetical protein